MAPRVAGFAGDAVARWTWTDALNREIVAASFEPGASASVVARRHDVNTNQLFIWRRLDRDGVLLSTDTSGPALLPVTIMGEQAGEKPLAPPDVPPPALPRPGRIEIELPSGYRIRVDAAIDGKALRRVLDVLERR